MPAADLKIDPKTGTLWCPACLTGHLVYPSGTPDKPGFTGGIVSHRVCDSCGWALDQVIHENLPGDNKGWVI